MSLMCFAKKCLVTVAKAGSTLPPLSPRPYGNLNSLILDAHMNMYIYILEEIITISPLKILTLLHVIWLFPPVSLISKTLDSGVVETVLKRPYLVISACTSSFGRGDPPCPRRPQS